MPRSIGTGSEAAVSHEDWPETDASMAVTSGLCTPTDEGTTLHGEAGEVPAIAAYSGPTHDVANALLYGLELLQRGALLVQSDLAPCLANRRAAEILRRQEGLSLSRAGIVAEQASDTRALARLLHEVMAFPQRGEPVGSPLRLTRKHASSTMVIRVLPGPDLAGWPGTHAKTALMTISNSDQKALVSELELTRLYGLTRGEAALAVRMVRGKSLDEAATELFISAHTARTHLKRIFLKTDTHRQSELVGRLLASAL